MADTISLSNDDTAQLIGESFAKSEASRLPKHIRLYDAVILNIDAGHLPAGHKLPGERDLSVATGISLGTVQKGLSQLVAEGRIQREHGRGSFVSPSLPPLTDLWHYRFREPESGQLLPVFAQLVERKQVPGDDQVIHALGLDKLGYVRISRVIDLDGRFQCWSEMHLPFARFGELLETTQHEIESVNLKILLANRFSAPTVAIKQTVQAVKFPKDIAQQIGVPLNSFGLRLQIVGFSREREPVTFQRIYVPATGYEMEVGSEPSLQDTQTSII
ncbi:GntR family transcriptional regulator [Pseudomonas machongensis]